MVGTILSERVTRSDAVLKWKLSIALRDNAALELSILNRDS